ncbi:MAG: hypothetical protein K6A92_02520 [Lachnospiraceae bacterium]|nr:hypothetical protein [Lachnospiraceae bacterium]
MNFEEAVDEVYASHMAAEPYQDRYTPDIIKRHPELTKDLLTELASRREVPTVLVTGSKGKGSAARMLQTLLSSAGSVGLMTSPHLHDFNDRFRVGDAIMPEEDLARIVEGLKPSFDAIQSRIPKEQCISPMGYQAAIALTWFQEKKVSFRILECGKGVKSDDVGNVPHGYAMINGIFREHTRELGPELMDIAANKAAILSPETRAAAIAPQEEEVLELFLKRAEETGTKLLVYGRDFAAEDIRYSKQGMEFAVRTSRQYYENVKVPLLGEHQARNAALAIALAEEILADVGAAWQDGQQTPEIPKRSAGVRNVAVSALQEISWPGRMEVVSREPFCMVDASINRESAREVVKVLEELKREKALKEGEKLTFVIGVPDDKDYFGVVSTILPYAKEVILTGTVNRRYVFAGIQLPRLQEAYPEMPFSCITDLRELPALSKASLQAGGWTKGPTVILGTTALIENVYSPAILGY